MIRVNNLEKYYNKGKKSEQHVLNDVNLEFGNTGLVCILGESGSGKTTLLNTIGGLDDFSGGSVEINGKKITGYSPKIIDAIRNEHFGYIFQNYYILQEYSVEYNVKLALNRYNLTEQEKDERTDYILDMLGILKYKKKLVSRLSGGQQQRVSIARALVKAPDIILADEPTGNLDEENTLKTMMILKSISKECLVIVVTHEKRIAKFFADRIIKVCDGKIISDAPNNATAYQRSDDANIYLKEYEKETINSQYADFKLYHGQDETPEKLMLNFVWKDEKLYIQNLMPNDIVIANDENGIRILDEERPSLDIKDVENFEYNLTRLDEKKNVRLPLREVWNIAKANISVLGKKQGFIAIILLASAILLSITTAKFVNDKTIDEKSIVSTDSHYVQLDFKNISVFDYDDQVKILDFAKQYMTDKEYGDIFCVPSANMYLKGKVFRQLRELGQNLSGFSYVSYEHLDKKDILYGRMPKKRNEVVIDKQVIDRMTEKKSAVTLMYSGYKSYIGAKISDSSDSKILRVVGISDTSEPTVYCNQNVLLGFSENSYKLESVDEFKEENVKGYENPSLGDNEVLLRKGFAESEGYEVGDTIEIGDDIETHYTIVGTFPDSLDIDYVFSDKGCENIKCLMVYDNRSCLIYTDNIQKTKKYYKKTGAEQLDVFAPSMTVPHDDEIKKYIEENSNDSLTGNLITVVAVIISIIMIYFMIKSNAMTRSEELTVYRMFGISNRSIITAFIMELYAIASVTTLPAVLVTAGVIKVISLVPSLNMGIIFPWWAVLGLLICIYLAYAIICILPIKSILAKPPAALDLK